MSRNWINITLFLIGVEIISRQFVSPVGGGGGGGLLLYSFI